MLLCRGVRWWSVASSEPALKASGLLRVRGDGRSGVTWTLPHHSNQHVSLHECRLHRLLFTSTADLHSSSSSSSVWRRGGDGEQTFIAVKHSSSRLVTADSTAGRTNRCPGGGGAAEAGVLWVCSPLHGTTRTTGTTRTMHTRASSRHKPEEEPGETDNKGEPQHPKEPSTSPSSSSSSSSSPSSSSAGPEGGLPSKAQQLKKVFKEYGAVGVSFHICMSLMSLGMFYLLVSSGIDMAAMLCKLGFSEAVVQSKMAAGTSTFVLAYAVHKLFAPVRISITLVSVPLLVRYLRKTGLFKPPPVP